MERDPTKRKVKPAQALFEFEDLGESSDDSDFRIEDHCEESDDDSIDSNENEQTSGGVASDDSDGTSDISDLGEALSENKTSDYLSILSEQQNKKKFNPKDALNILICSVCLGERSDAANEIIECDNCGVTVHEGCYGVQDSDSVCSTDSPTPTTPWFCDACKAGQDDPECELCPNSGGIFKETDVGKWVHLVCALYMPGVAFAEVDKLQSVTLFEMAYSKWGAKACSLCPDQRFARTGVAVGCDAGMCKTHFHVTCGQREGLLAEAHSEEVDQADPFYAHCKLHTDKNLMRKRRRNWLAVQMRIEEARKIHRKETEDSLRIQRRLGKYRTKYGNARLARGQPWVPTQKMGRLLTTSASACRALWRKAELSGVDTEGWALRQAQVEALSDVHRRWHIQPAFSVEFIGYYLDRNLRVTSMRKQLAELVEENGRLLDEQSSIESKRDRVLKDNTQECDRNKLLKSILAKYHELITLLCPNKKLPDLEMMGYSINQLPQYTESLGSIPMATARKTVFGGPVSSDADLSDNSSGAGRVCLNNVCGLCRGRHDQHLLAKCDTCRKHYHLACLNPPLTRMPKKTKLMGWQCSECDKDSSSSDADIVDTEAPRKLRHKDNGDSSLSEFKYDSRETSLMDTSTIGEHETSTDIKPEVSETSVSRVKKRRREKHHRYSPDPDSIRPHKHKHKRSKQQEEQRQSLKICFKSVPSTGGGSSYVATPSSSLAPRPPSPSVSTASVHDLPQPTPSLRLSTAKKKEEPKTLMCVTCNNPGDPSNTVRCDECLLGFHFQCLDPPVKKSPKVRGYSWHCANCDPTESE